MASVAAGVPFGFGMVLVFLAIMNYLIDAYVIFGMLCFILAMHLTYLYHSAAASVLAANAVLRSLFGATFPLFTTYMYRNLGLHWASSVPAFLALACVPFPFVLYKYGPVIRKRCKYAREAAEFMDRLRQQEEDANNDEGGDDSETTTSEPEKDGRMPANPNSSYDKLDREHNAEQEAVADEEPEESVDYNYEHDGEYEMETEEERRYRAVRAHPGRPAALALQRTSTNASRNYDRNPFDLDRVATRDSFRHERSGQTSARTSARNSMSEKRSGKLNRN
jgi:hypothetical protein